MAVGSLRSQAALLKPGSCNRVIERVTGHGVSDLGVAAGVREGPRMMAEMSIAW